MVCEMCFKSFFVMVIVRYGAVMCVKESDIGDTDYDYLDIYEQNDHYHGENFPVKYLSVDGINPTAANLTSYVENLMRTVSYFAATPNDSDPNVGLGLFFMKALLKRTLLDYGDKIEDLEKRDIKHIIDKSEYLLSHFIYESILYGGDDLYFQLSGLLKFDEALVHTIGNFKKNAIKKWIYSNLRLHEHIEEMDNITLSRYKYAELANSMDDFYKISDSDHCIAGIHRHALPIKYNIMKACRWNEFCTERVLKMPSFAYILSHRLVYILGLHLTRRCYILSEEVDKIHMDIMCANMYREAVYLARRGYFYRDLFLEHVALCGLLGYEEFFRHNWFKKVVSWIDEEGCIVENRNFELNQTMLYLAKEKTTQKQRRIKKMKLQMMAEDCQHHQMALLMIVLGHAIRYTAHYM